MSCSVEVSAVAVAVPVVASIGDGQQMNVPAFVAMLSAATDEQLADILAIFHRGNDLWTRRTLGSAEQEAAVVAPVAEEIVKPSASKKEKAVKEKAPKVDSVTHAKRVTGPKKEKAEKAEKPKKEKAVKAPVALPEAVEGAPAASEYRIPEADIDSSVCVARLFNETEASKDKRWKPAVYRELQCGGKVADGSDLCTKCSKRQEKYAEEPKAGPWTGRVTEDPLDWCHMLGTVWATDKAPKFIGNDSEPAPPAAGEAAPVSDKAAAKEAAKAQKEAAKEAAAAEKVAQKAAAAAEKAAAKEAAKASKPKKPTKKAAPASEVKVAAATEVTEVEGELMCIDGEMYMIKKGNVYEYDEIAEKTGDFVGRLTADKTINTEADEEAASESDSD